MRRDERLIDLFLRGYRHRAGNSYRLVERSDRVERRRPPFDCIAENERGDRLAVKYTLIYDWLSARLLSWNLRAASHPRLAGRRDWRPVDGGHAGPSVQPRVRRVRLAEALAKQLAIGSSDALSGGGSAPDVARASIHRDARA